MIGTERGLKRISSGAKLWVKQRSVVIVISAVVDALGASTEVPIHSLFMEAFVAQFFRDVKPVRHAYTHIHGHTRVSFLRN